MASKIVHTGKVIDRTGNPLVGAHVVLNDPSLPKGTITDFDGNFRVEGVSGDRYKISHLGMSTAYFTLSTGMQPKTYTLNDSGITLDEVVVTAPKKKSNALGFAMVLAAMVMVGVKYFKP